MNFKDLMDSLMASAHTLSTFWVSKLILSYFIAVFTSDHACKLYIFAALVFGDLLCKMYALAYKCQNDVHDATDPISVILAFHKARQLHYIKSNEMKHRFSGKILLYMTTVFAGVGVDRLIGARTIGFANIIIIYLAITEMVSILENLQEADIEGAGSLLHIINKICDRMKNKL